MNNETVRIPHRVVEEMMQNHFHLRCHLQVPKAYTQDDDELNPCYQLRIIGSAADRGNKGKRKTLFYRRLQG